MLRDKLIRAIEETAQIVERLIGLAKDEEVRNRLILRLAALDQRLAMLRDIPVVLE